MIPLIIDELQIETAGTEPVTLAEAKAQLIIDTSFTADDTFITDLITSARRAVENYCNVSCVPKRVTIISDISQEMELPYGPVVSIESVQVASGNTGSGTANYENATSWTQDGVQFKTFSPGCAGGNTIFNTRLDRWYNTDMQFQNRYKIVYTTGYSPVPQDLKRAILNEIAFRYENRGDMKDSNGGICEAAQVLANPYRRLQWV